MQAQGFIQSVGCDVNEFWRELNALAALFEHVCKLKLDFSYITNCVKFSRNFEPIIIES